MYYIYSINVTIEKRKKSIPEKKLNTDYISIPVSSFQYVKQFLETIKDAWIIFPDLNIK